jgi:hypothetical protein
LGAAAFAGGFVAVVPWALAGCASSSAVNALAASAGQYGREVVCCMVQIRVR